MQFDYHLHLSMLLHPPILIHETLLGFELLAIDARKPIHYHSLLGKHLAVDLVGLDHHLKSSTMT